MSKSTHPPLRTILWALALAALLPTLASCGDSSSTSPDGDADGDGSNAETGLDGDSPEMDGEEGAPDSDGEEDIPDSAEEEEDAPLCTMPDGGVPQDEPDLGQKKFALSMFHFNVQYVAGGLATEVDGEMQGMCGKACLEWSDERLQDWIITETFAPVLDFYVQHPGWRVTFEMQGMMLEAIAERHPAVLEQLRGATQSGQVEMVSFHWSDQLFLAFPSYDLRKSVEETKRIFDRHCIPLSAVVFNQEGQAGEGKHAFMRENGYSISVFPKNLYRYVRGEEIPRWPYYTNHGVDVIIGPGEVDPASGIEVSWTFFDDGELLTCPADPYFAPWSSANLDQLVEYEAELTGLQGQGFKITSVADYVRHLKAQGVEQPELPPVVDGTWQPTSTDSILRWLGGRSLAPYNNLERDNFIRTGNWTSRTLMQAADHMVAAARAGGIDTSEEEADLARGWREIWKAEVSDATGITPWLGEFNYGLSGNQNAYNLADGVIDRLVEALGWPHAMINLGTGEAQRLDDLPLPEAPDAAEAPFDVVVDAPTRDSTVSWLGFGNPDDLILEVVFGPGGDPTAQDVGKCRVLLSFPRTENRIIYSPGLIEDAVVSYGFEEFVFQKPEVYLPLANGLIGLGNGWWVIKELSSVHVAARVPNGVDEPFVQFVDETADPLGVTWRFRVLHAADPSVAVEKARSLNLAPVIYY